MELHLVYYCGKQQQQEALLGNSGNEILKHMTDAAIDEVAEKGSGASDRAVLLACYGLTVRNMSEKLDKLRWPLWFAGAMVGGSAAAQVLAKLIWGA